MRKFITDKYTMHKTVILLGFIFLFGSLHAQDLRDGQKDSSTLNLRTFTLKGQIQKEDKTPIKNVNIEVNGSIYTASNLQGQFRIQVKTGDEIVISNDDFETVYYTVKNDDRLTINVESINNRELSFIDNDALGSFETLIDSAKYYQSKSLDKSIYYITKSISKSQSKQHNAEAFETLADIYVEWKQYDLAITNYRISLNNTTINDVELKLAKAYLLDNNTIKSKETYVKIDESKLSNWQQVIYKEGLADVYFKMSELKKALNLYKDALEKAEAYNLQPKISDLNSKLGAVYAKMGVTNVADNYFRKALTLAAKESPIREIEETVNSADFKNSLQDYDAEIVLRKKAISTVEEDTNLIISTAESNLTPQKQNYKIGNAYYLQQNFTDAVPYLEKSIKQAHATKDLVVKKDATKKLSEVYSASKNYTKALETYKAYTTVVEELYRKKEQEISQAARFRKRITEKQNRILSLENDRLLTLNQITISQEKNKRQQFFIYALIGGLLLVLLLAFLMYKYIKQQRLANNLLALKSLRSQMNPHFIFNALNSVNSFIAVNDERTANKYLSDFSKLMRAVLENSEEDFIPLEKEIDLIQLYTKLEHFRFQDKFDYTIDVDENIVISEYNIPPMLLQPYIENAVWHGLRYGETKGLLTIEIKEENTNIINITITDNGIGRVQSKALKTNHQKKHNSKGLGNIAKRVEILNDMYKDKVSVTILDHPNDTGTQVSVRIKK